MTYNGGNLYTCFVSSCRKPSKPFIQTDAGRSLTYAETFDMAGRFAHALREDYGVRPGDRVAAQVEKSAEALVLYLACLRAGAVYLPLNTAYTLAELEYFIADAEPTLVVCSPAKGDAVNRIASKLPRCKIATLDEDQHGTLLTSADDKPSQFDDYPAADDDLAAILYTSGTTGRSKGAMLTHRNLGSNAATLAEVWEFTASDTLLHALPIFHTHGLFVATNVAMVSNASIILLPKFDLELVRANLKRATVMMGVPTFYTRLLQEAWLDSTSTVGMRLFISGSAPLLADTHREWSRRTGHKILERYGMTETNMITSNPLHGDRIPGTVGRPLPGVEVRVQDPDRGSLERTGEVGMIQVRGPNVFKGYWRMPEKTASEFQDGFFVTGDLGRLDSNGYLTIVGREKDLVISGGFNVYPKEVETEIDQIEGVIESAVVGVPHPDFGEGVTAVVVKRPNTALTERDIIAALGARLAKFKMPKKVIFVDTLPRNTMGKVTKKELKEQYSDLYV